MANCCVNRINQIIRQDGVLFFLYNYTEKIINTQHIHNYGFREAYYKYCGRSIVIGALHFGCGGRQNDKRLFDTF